MTRGKDVSYCLVFKTKTGGKNAFITQHFTQVTHIIFDTLVSKPAQYVAR